MPTVSLSTHPPTCLFSYPWCPSESTCLSLHPFNFPTLVSSDSICPSVHLISHPWSPESIQPATCPHATGVPQEPSTSPRAVTGAGGGRRDLGRAGTKLLPRGSTAVRPSASTGTVRAQPHSCLGWRHAGMWAALSHSTSQHCICSGRAAKHRLAKGRGARGLHSRKAVGANRQEGCRPRGEQGAQSSSHKPLTERETSNFIMKIPQQCPFFFFPSSGSGTLAPATNTQLGRGRDPFWELEM